MRRIIVIICFSVIAPYCFAQRALFPSQNLVSDRTMSVMFNRLVPEYNYLFSIVVDPSWDSSYSLVCTTDHYLIYREFHARVVNGFKIRVSRHKIDTKRVYIGEYYSNMLLELMDAAASSASYSNYFSPDDGVCYYYRIYGRYKAAMHYSPLPDNIPDIPSSFSTPNNVRKLTDFLQVLIVATECNDISGIKSKEEDILSLTLSFKELCPEYE